MGGGAHRLTVPRYFQFSPTANDREELSAVVASSGANVPFVSTHGNSHIPARRPNKR